MKTTLLRDCMLISALLGAGALLPLGCETQGAGPSTGSESHFLKSCSGDAECGRLTCLCGVCSSACDEDSQCTGLHDTAACVPNRTRPDEAACPTPPEAMCDVRCDSHVECSSLGSAMECVNGFCRDAPSTPVGSDGSGGAPPASEIADDGRIELDELCSMYQDSVCTKRMRCEADPGFCDDTHCRDAVGCGDLEAVHASIERGHLVYDPVAAADCYASLQNDPCHFTYGLVVVGMPSLVTLLNACPGALTAEQDVGATCYGEEECVFGTTCDLELACPGTCVVDDPPKGVEGDPCTTNFGPEQECVQPLVCLLPASTESGEQECGPAPNVGDPCESPSQCRCNGPEALCYTLGCDLSLGECVPLSEVGEACSTLDATGVPDCLAPAWCDGGFEGGVCRPPSGPGESCSIYSDCQPPLTCIDAVCVPVAAPGEICTLSGDCLRGDCVDGLCAAPAAEGEACEADGDCAMGSMCSEGVCRPFACPREACGEAAPCLEGRCASGSCVPWSRPGDGCASDVECAARPGASELFCVGGVCSPASECW